MRSHEFSGQWPARWSDHEWLFPGPRRKQKLTLADLAAFAGVSPTFVYPLEKGKQSIRLEFARKVFLALNLQPELKLPEFAAG
jgi:transcriptional regulator with XRE-family HTH domain